MSNLASHDSSQSPDRRESGPDRPADPYADRRVVGHASENYPRKPRVAVVFGGRSSEHGVSVVTAASVLSAIDRDKYDVLPIGITTEGRWALTADDPERMAIADRRMPTVEQVTDHEGAVMLPVDPANREVVYTEAGAVPKALGEVDVVFPMLHGPYGEDGTLQGLLELSGVPYVGAGVLASAVGMDKEYMKRVFTSFGLAVGPYTVIRPRAWERDSEAVRREVTDFAAEHGWPLFVKPARAGSSFGITKVDGPEGLDAAITEARRHDPKVIVEALLRGREIECGVLEFEDGPRASVPAEIPPVTSHAFYDFEAKYIDSAEGIVPAPLTEEQTAEVRRLAVEAFEAASCEGLVRADFFLLDSGEFVINEINTMPGFTPISMYPRMWRETGVDYRQLVDLLIQAALRRSTGLR
ncbi:D-alanine--D-alanine ligase family protein [Streptomyces sp. CBMA29]|uniref:D-alanine--D-alanine ligase family protein n=1 Tax=Streptomyces sp. CBMA29 TaxID=1896314 RepID=UPI00166209DE|nr:D-alanine--D-alanine ligase family protein [Streptomyces sp. CBMA29]